ncbi:hypothetical protein RHSIM_Rhsim03G0183200 [Rhododendron simsii]|uniref:Leucine-rich repeat-containing N-terminal plant-type domain-containing protein n=1 Tax=Rhododendron simsii TaxID=118357 RepID=A0A834LQH6_RHOSS|nr:hypothetical protein RHSIM_Rhsim03G0183200 [Rhododendron simsii]
MIAVAAAISVDARRLRSGFSDFDFPMADWIKETREGYKQSDLASQCMHRYEIYIEGSAWSAQEFGKAASDFIQEDLKMDYVYDYMIIEEVYDEINGEGSNRRETMQHASSSCLGCGSIPAVTCIEQERQALLKFKRSLTDPTRRLSTWTDEDCCNWKGIQCDGNTSHVVKLDLVSLDPDAATIEANEFPFDRKKKIEANEVNPSLLELKYLEHLDLSGNNFHNIPIPIFFGSMTSLRYLNLSHSNFSGRVPHRLGNVSNLMVLDLNCIDTEWVTNGFFTFSRDVLSLLTIDDFTWVSRLSSLQYLDASGMNLSRALNLNVMLNMLPSLTELRLSRCELYSTLLVSHFYLNSTASNIRKLDLSINSFAGEFPKFIENLTALRVLDLSSNYYLNSSFPLYLENLKSLEHLNLASNSFTGDVVGCQEAMEIYLDAPCNLERLILSSNQSISGNLPDWLGQFKRLKYLDLSWNSFSHPIPDLFVKLQLLKYLDLSGNSFSGSIPQSLGTLSALEVLRIYENQLNGTIPVSLGQLSSLKILDIRHNQLTGTIPVSLGQLSNLKILDLSSNHLEGVLTEANFANLTSLEELSMDSNLLTLKWLRTQKKVSFLDISNASISGTLPQWLDEMPLVILDLSHNLIGGPIQKLPSTLWALVLSDNLWTSSTKYHFYGELPLTLRNCTSLIVLDLGENRFSGSIPTWIGDLSLQVLRLHKNMFIDNIPSQLCQMLDLQIMDLGNNLLTGPIPRCLGNLSAMILDESISEFCARFDVELSDTSMTQVIKGRELEFTSGILVFLANMDLSGNNLVGSIPKEITNLSGLSGLNLSHNNLIGKIPEKIGGLKSLESLDFSKNQLSGIIPQSISGLNFLSRLNLSYNNLSGRIPTGNQLQTPPSSSYLGNSELCGDPLPRKCRGDEKSQPPTATGHREEHEEDDSEKVWFYAAIMSGYATGLWGFIGVLLLKKSWRHAYFRFVVMVKDKGLKTPSDKLRTQIDGLGGENPYSESPWMEQGTVRFLLNSCIRICRRYWDYDSDSLHLTQQEYVYVSVMSNVLLIFVYSLGLMSNRDVVGIYFYMRQREWIVPVIDDLLDQFLKSLRLAALDLVFVSVVEPGLVKVVSGRDGAEKIYECVEATNVQIAAMLFLLITNALAALGLYKFAYVLVESNGTSVSPLEISGCIADNPDQEQSRIVEELQETIRASTKLGIKYDDAGVLRMNKMIEQEAKDLESILRDNSFAPLQRKKLHPKAPKE